MSTVRRLSVLIEGGQALGYDSAVSREHRSRPARVIALSKGRAAKERHTRRARTLRPKAPAHTARSDLTRQLPTSNSLRPKDQLHIGSWKLEVGS